MGTPAFCFSRQSRRQVPNVAVQASMANTWRPSSVGVKTPRQRSFSWNSMGTVCQAGSPSRRQRSAAVITSCPSRNMSAVTSIGSPAIRLTAKRPPSTLGSIASMKKVRLARPGP